MSALRRGALAALVLACGCKSPPARTVTTPPAAHAPMERVAPPDPPDAAMGLGPLTLLEAVPASSEPQSAPYQTSAATEEGVISVHSWPVNEGRVWPEEICASEDPQIPYCRLTSFGAFRKSGQREVVTWSAPTRIIGDWPKLYGGEHDVFGVRFGEHISVDKIGRNGDVTLLGEGPVGVLTYSRETRLLDLGSRVLTLFFDPWSPQPLRLMSFSTTGAEKGEQPKLTTMGLFPVHPTRLMQQIFFRASDAARPMLGEPAIAAWRDAKGARDGTWVMAWRELPDDTPPLQIPMSSAGIPKRTVVARLSSDGAILAKKVLGTSKKQLSELGDLKLRVWRDSIALGDDQFDAKLHPMKKAPPLPAETTLGELPKPTWKSPPFEKVVAAGYDPFRAEGIAVVTDSISTRAIRFDALGRSLGEPVTVVLPQEGKAFRAMLAGDTWILVPESTLKSFSISVLTGPRAGTVISALMPGQTFATTVFARDDGRLVAARLGPLEDSGDALRAELATAEIKLDGAAIGEWKEQSIPLELSDVTAVLAVVHGAPGAMRWIARRRDGSLVILRGLPDSALAIEGEPLFGPGALRPRARVYDVWSDSVVRVDVLSEDHVTWLSSGLTLPVTDHLVRGRSEPLVQAGPLLAGGILPPSAGSSTPAADDVIAELPSCDHALPTGPRRAVLLCSEAVTKETPSRRAGTRVLRW